MRLRTLAGAYAGLIREYDFSAATSALKSGMAERVDETPRVDSFGALVPLGVPPICEPVGRSPRMSSRVKRRATATRNARG